MDDFLNNLDTADCAFVGEGVVFKGSIAAAGKLVVLGTVEGQVEASELLVAADGIVKGDVRVDQAHVLGTVLENIEATIYLRLSQTGRIEGTALYGEIEVEKGGILVGRMSERNTGQSESVRAPSVLVAEIRSGSSNFQKENKVAS
jgi:cytoskeletal protein CcmA (bactofilin family)